MNYQQSTGISIQEAFENYHNVNPKVYEAFKRLAFEAINKGKTKLSFKLILNKIRWEVYMETIEPNLFTYMLDGKPVKAKINDAFSSRYARMFINDFPQHRDKIEMRELRS